MNIDLTVPWKELLNSSWGYRSFFYLFLTESFFVFLAFSFTLYKLARGSRRRKWEALLSKEYYALLFPAMMEFAETGKHANNILLPKDPEEKALLRRTILDLCLNVAGKERVFFSELYAQLGYLAKDAENLDSRLWWKKLEAIVTLDEMGYTGSQEKLKTFTRNSHPLISMAATRALSSTNNDDAADFVFSHLKRRGLWRRDALIEVLSELGQHHPSHLVRFFNESSSFQARQCSLIALGNLRITEALPSILLLIRSPKTLEELVSAAADCLGKLSDEKGWEALSLLLEHPKPRVRIQAIRQFSHAHKKLTPAQRNRLLRDRSEDVRRAVERYDTARAA